jgi:hypothetical protein
MDWEGWLRQRVAQAVEAGEVSPTVLADLDGHETEPFAERLARVFRLPAEKIEHALLVLEATSLSNREVAFRELVDTWLTWLRQARRPPC